MRKVRSGRVGCIFQLIIKVYVENKLVMDERGRFTRESDFNSLVNAGIEFRS
jgi:hypothetical protein